MKYLCLGYHDEQAVAALPATEREALKRECIAFEQLLRRGGQLIDVRSLQSVRNAVVLRSDAGKVAVTDGPFAETKEQLGGIMLIEAADLNHAIQLMSQ